MYSFNKHIERGRVPIPHLPVNLDGAFVSVVFILRAGAVTKNLGGSSGEASVSSGSLLFSVLQELVVQFKFYYYARPDLFTEDVVYGADSLEIIRRAAKSLLVSEAAYKIKMRLWEGADRFIPKLREHIGNHLREETARRQDRCG